MREVLVRLLIDARHRPGGEIVARYLAQYGPYSDAVLSDVLLQRSLSELYYLATELPVPSYDTGCICCSANGPSTHVAGCAYKAYENYT